MSGPPLRILLCTIVVDGRVLGHVARFPLDGKPQLTYWIAREAWGRGLATRAVALFLREVTERPLFASAAADNAGSIRVLERAGFQRVGSAPAHAPARAASIEEAFFVLPA